MAIMEDSQLEGTVDRLETKSERIENASDIQAKQKRVIDSIDRLTDAISDLEDAADTLQFHLDVLTGVFDDSRPSAVDDAIRTARDAVDISEDKLLDTAEDEQISTLVDEVSDAEDKIESTTGTIQDKIEEHQDEWSQDLSQARELNSIIGGDNSEFTDIIGQMRQFLEQAIWDQSNNSQTLATRWELLRERWEDNKGRHGWEAFSNEYDIPESTTNELKQFTDEDTVRLADLSVSTLKHIKGVDELESALEVRLRS